MGVPRKYNLSSTTADSAKSVLATSSQNHRGLVIWINNQLYVAAVAFVNINRAELIDNFGIRSPLR